MKINKKFLLDNITTIFYAFVIAIIIRSLLFQPFYIPSSSMEPNLLVGDRLFVSKYTYGYSNHSFPFSPRISNKRFFFKEPKRGDVIVFKTPADNRTDYIKRLVGLSGDEIQFINGDLYINNNQVLKTKKNIKDLKIYCGNIIIDAVAFDEKLPDGVIYTAVYKKKGSLQNSDKYIVRSIRLPDKVWNMMKNISNKSYRPLNSQLIKIFEDWLVDHNYMDESERSSNE